MSDRGPVNLTLQEAYNRAKSALDAGATARAIAIVQHILRYYPRYVDAYLLLGEAHVDQGRADDALRLFTHVLQVDPQNVLARIGRAIIAEDRGEIEAAIDEYERAFEIDPSIPELRGELLRVYTLRYGSAGATIRTTPSGLAYMHLRAGLRDAAISEFSQVIQARPDRWDLEVALVEALWRNERLDDVEVVATDILAAHPSCIKCNWLLGYLHWTTGRTPTGREYLLDAVALDPTYTVAERLWAATPWPLDRRLTRAQPARIPTWSAEELAAANVRAGLQGLALESAPAAPEPERRRVTQKFAAMPGLPEAPRTSRAPTTPLTEMPPLPPESGATAPESTTAASAPPAPEAPAAREGAAGTATPAEAEPGPPDVQMEWFDEWAALALAAPPPPEASAATSGAPASPTAATPAAPEPEPLLWGEAVGAPPPELWATVGAAPEPEPAPGEEPDEGTGTPDIDMPAVFTWHPGLQAFDAAAATTLDVADLEETPPDAFAAVQAPAPEVAAAAPALQGAPVEAPPPELLAGLAAGEPAPGTLPGEAPEATPEAADGEPGPAEEQASRIEAVAAPVEAPPEASAAGAAEPAPAGPAEEAGPAPETPAPAAESVLILEPAPEAAAPMVVPEDVAPAPVEAEAEAEAAGALTIVPAAGAELAARQPDAGAPAAPSALAPAPTEEPPPPLEGEIPVAAPPPAPEGADGAAAPPEPGAAAAPPPPEPAPLAAESGDLGAPDIEVPVAFAPEPATGAFDPRAFQGGEAATAAPSAALPREPSHWRIGRILGLPIAPHAELPPEPTAEAAAPEAPEPAGTPPWEISAATGDEEATDTATAPGGDGGTDTTTEPEDDSLWAIRAIPPDEDEADTSEPAPDVPSGTGVSDDLAPEPRALDADPTSAKAAETAGAAVAAADPATPAQTLRLAGAPPELPADAAAGMDEGAAPPDEPGPDPGGQAPAAGPSAAGDGGATTASAPAAADPGAATIPEAAPSEADVATAGDGSPAGDPPADGVVVAAALTGAAVAEMLAPEPPRPAGSGRGGRGSRAQRRARRNAQAGPPPAPRRKGARAAVGPVDPHPTGAAAGAPEAEAEASSTADAAADGRPGLPPERAADPAAGAASTEAPVAAPPPVAREDPAGAAERTDANAASSGWEEDPYLAWLGGDLLLDMAPFPQEAGTPSPEDTATAVAGQEQEGDIPMAQDEVEQARAAQPTDEPPGAVPAVAGAAAPPPAEAADEPPDEDIFAWIGHADPVLEADEGEFAANLPAPRPYDPAPVHATPPGPAPYEDPEPPADGGDDYDLEDWLGRTSSNMEAEISDDEAGDASAGAPPVLATHAREAHSGESGAAREFTGTPAVTQEEGDMAPSYKEDDDQGRQFDFDWDHEALPDYLKPFLMDEPGQPTSVAAAPPEAGPPLDAAAEVPAAPPEAPAPVAPFAAAPGPPPGPPMLQPDDFEATAAGELDFADLPRFDFDAIAAGDFGFADNEEMPDWLAPEGGTMPAAAVPAAAEDDSGLPDWLRDADAAAEEPATGAPWLGAGPAGGPGTPGAPPAPFMGGMIPPVPPRAPDPVESSAEALPPAERSAAMPPIERSAEAMSAVESHAEAMSPVESGAAPEAGAPPQDAAAAERGPAAVAAEPAAASEAPEAGESFDFGDLQPFQFNAEAAPPDVGADADDFIDFLSVSAPFDGEDAAEPAAPAAPAAPSGREFEIPADLEPFSFESLELEPAAVPEAPEAAAPEAPMAAEWPPAELPEAPHQADATAFGGDEFDFEPFMFDQAGAAAAPPAAPPPAPVAQTAMDDLDSIQPFSMDSLDLDNLQEGGWSAADSAPGPVAMPFSPEEEDAAAPGDIHRYSWQRPAAQRPVEAAPTPLGESDDSIFAKAKRRKEELAEQMRAEAAARGEPPPSTAEISAEMAEELRYWAMPEDEAPGAGATPAAEAPSDLFADMPVEPFSFDEASIFGSPLPAPPPAASGMGTPAPEYGAEAPAEAPLDFSDLEFQPFSFDEATILEGPVAPPPAAAPAAAAAPEVPAFAAETPPTAELEAAPPPSSEQDLLADFADLQVMPFSFDEAGILSETPPAPAPSAPAPEPAAAAPEEPAAQAPAAMPAEAPLTTPLDFADLEFEPFSFDEATILQSNAPPPPAAAVPPAPPAAELPPMPAEAPAAEAPAAPEVPAAGAAAPGAEAAIEDFDFGDIQPFDLSALELTPEERAYLMGDSSGDALEATAGQARAATEATPVEEALADEPAAADAGGILELQTLQTYVAERQSTQDIQPFTFDESAYTSPIGEDAEEPPAAAPTAPPPPAVPAQSAPEPHTAALPEEPSPYATEALGAQRAEAGAESPSPFALPDEDLFGAESWTEMSMDRIFDFNAFSPETAALGAEQVEPTEAASGDITRAFGEAEIGSSGDITRAFGEAEVETPEATAAAPPEATPGTEEAAPVEVPAMPAAMEPAAAAPAAAPAAPAPAQPASAPLSDPIDALVRRLEEAPDDTATRLALAGAYEQRDDYTHAAEQYRKLIKGRTVPAPVLDIVAENLRDLVDSRPDDPVLHRLLGDAYMKQGQFQMAITQYNWLLTQGGH